MHPNASIKLHRSFKTGLFELSSQSLELDLEWSDMLLTDSMTSVSLEASHIGIPVATFRDAKTPDLSPLFGKKASPLFWDRKSLVSFIDDPKPIELSDNEKLAFNRKISKWADLFLRN
jgi:hypothetical protein